MKLKLVKFVSAIAIAVLLLGLSCAVPPETSGVPTPAPQPSVTSTPTSAPASPLPTTPEPTEKDGIPVFPESTETSIPPDMKMHLSIDEALDCQGYSVPAERDEVAIWYHDQLTGWELVSEQEFTPPDQPEMTATMKHYRSGGDGLLLFFSTGFMSQTLYGIATGPWSLVEGCGRFEVGPQSGGLSEPDFSGEDIEFAFPIDLDQIHYEGGGIAPFGMHDGDHPEGLDHIWVYPKSADTPVKATADGLVERVSGESGNFEVHIKHSERFTTEYFLLNSIVVKEGDELKKGETVGYPIPCQTWVPTYFFDYWLMDMSRNDGVWVYGDSQMGSRVSPYEYLAPDVKMAIEELYREEMYNVYRDRGKQVGVFNPYEPKLTNPIFLHPGNEGTPVGVWLSLDRKWEEDGVPDMVTILKVDNEFHTGYRFIFYDGWIYASQETGSCKVDSEAGEIIFRIAEPSSKTYYGIFEVTEGDRATLKLEYRQGSSPSVFSDDALNFVIRSQRMPRDEVAEQFPELSTR